MRRWSACLLLLCLGWLVTPSPLPVYDGVGAPDQPYRYAGTGKPPRPVSLQVPVRNGTSSALQLKSAETGPQVLLDLASGAFSAPGSQLTVTAEPLPPDGTPPRGRIDGNVYRITAGSGAVLRPASTQGFLFLRAAVMTRPDPVIVHRRVAADPWLQVRTNRSGRDIMSTPFRELGDYAVVRLPGSTPLGDGGLGVGRLLLLGGGVLLLVLGTLVVLRRGGNRAGAGRAVSKT